MVQVSAGLVKQLRDRTGAGMMNCKRALAETGADLDAAVDWLRKNGLAAAAKKAGRVAAEGLVAVATDGNRGAVVEVNSETDFVGRNAEFQAFVASVVALALGRTGGVEELALAPMTGGATVADTLTEFIARIGENMSLRRAETIEVGEGVVGSYVHNAVAPGLGRIGVLVGLATGGAGERVEALAKQLAMQIAAANPRWLRIEDVDSDALERERAILTEQARASGRPEKVLGKMVEGRLRKFFEENVLFEQTFVVDGETKVSEVIAAAAEEVGAPIAVEGFAHFTLGEGIGREKEDFASEVAAVLKD